MNVSIYSIDIQFLVLQKQRIVEKLKLKQCWTILTSDKSIWILDSILSIYVTYFQFQFSNWNRIPAKICDFSYPSCMKTQNKLSAWKIGKNFFNRNRKFYIQDKNLFLKILQLNDWYMLWRQSLLVLAEKYFDILNSRDMIWRLRLNFLLVVFNLIWKRSSFRVFAQITLIWHECLMRISTNEIVKLKDC